MNVYALRWSVCVVAVVASFVFVQDVVDEGRIDVGDGVELYYQRYGEGPVGLVAMGRSFTAASLAPLAGDRAVVVYDTRSRGKSTAVDDDEVMGWQYELADLDAVIARLADRPVTIVGWSLWGGFAAVYAARHPERVEGLVMIGPMAPTVGMRARPDMPQNPTYQAKQELGRLEDAGVKESAPAEYCAAELRVAYADQVVDIAALVDRLPIICEDPNEHLEHVDATIRTILRSLGGWDFEAERPRDSRARPHPGWGPRREPATDRGRVGRAHPHGRQGGGASAGRAHRASWTGRKRFVRPCATSSPGSDVRSTAGCGEAKAGRRRFGGGASRALHAAVTESPSIRVHGTVAMASARGVAEDRQDAESDDDPGKGAPRSLPIGRRDFGAGLGGLRTSAASERSVEHVGYEVTESLR